MDTRRSLGKLPTSSPSSSLSYSSSFTSGCSARDGARNRERRGGADDDVVGEHGALPHHGARVHHRAVAHHGRLHRDVFAQVTFAIRYEPSTTHPAPTTTPGPSTDA